MQLKRVTQLSTTHYMCMCMFTTNAVQFEFVHARMLIALYPLTSLQTISSLNKSLQMDISHLIHISIPLLLLHHIYQNKFIRLAVSRDMTTMFLFPVAIVLCEAVKTLTWLLIAI